MNVLAIVILLIVLTFDSVICDTTNDAIPEFTETADYGKEAMVDPASNSKSVKTTNTEDSVVEASLRDTNPHTVVVTDKGEKVRIITMKELAFHDGKQTPTVWLSIMSQVFDVTAGPEYYSEAGPYRVFVGRDGNVPFVTGIFNPEEAAKPLSSLEADQLSNLQNWVQFYIDEDKYPFIGLLEGKLYDKDGNPTEEMKLVQDKLDRVEEIVAERRKKKANIIERRKREDEERKRKKLTQINELKKKKIKGERTNRFITSVWQYFQGKQDKEL